MILLIGPRDIIEHLIVFFLVTSSIGIQARTLTILGSISLPVNFINDLNNLELKKCTLAGKETTNMKKGQSSQMYFLWVTAVCFGRTFFSSVYG